VSGGRTEKWKDITDRSLNAVDVTCLRRMYSVCVQYILLVESVSFPALTISACGVEPWRGSQRISTIQQKNSFDYCTSD
jgi:hypothetical protein